MKIRIVICYFIAAIITVGFLPFTSVSFAAASCFFVINTDPEGVKGESFEVTVTGKDVRNLSAYDLCLSFDSGLLEFKSAVSAIEGYTVLVPVKGNEVRLAVAKFGGAPAENGDIKLCTFTFRVKAAGRADITLKSVKVMDEILASSNYTSGSKVSVSIVADTSDPDSDDLKIIIPDSPAPGSPALTFTDVAENAWYAKAVGFMAERGIIQGVGNGRFAPELNVIRADFLIMVMRFYGISPETNIADNFADAGNKHYTQYLAAAKQLGLVTGVGNNRFAPEESISRQDMFVILYRVLKKLEKLPQGTSGKTLESFRDAGDIAVYAREAMKLFVETGTVRGDGANLAPRATSTRAQAAQVLFNMLSN